MFENYNKELSKHGFGSNSKWVKFEPGQPVKGLLVGRERTGVVKFEQGSGFIQCPKEKGGNFRFAMIFWNGETYQALEGGKRLYQAIGDLASSGVALERTVIKITKTGVGPQTKFSVVAVKELEKDEYEKIVGGDIPPLSALCSWVGFEPEDDPRGKEPEELPF